MTVLIAIETVVIALLCVLVAGLLRSHADILRRLHALDPGSDAALPAGIDLGPTRSGAGRRAHDLSGTSLGDDHVHVAIAGTRHRTLLAFLSSGCLTCANFWNAFAGGVDLPADVRLVVVTKSASEESASSLRKLAAPGLAVVMASDAWTAYDVPGSPYFVLADGAADRIEGEGTGANWAQVENLMLQADGRAREARIDRELLASGIQPGDPILYRDGSPR